jgi:hypothetical protein
MKQIIFQNTLRKMLSACLLLLISNLAFAQDAFRSINLVNDPSNFPATELLNINGIGQSFFRPVIKTSRTAGSRSGGYTITVNVQANNSGNWIDQIRVYIANTETDIWESPAGGDFIAGTGTDRLPVGTYTRTINVPPSKRVLVVFRYNGYLGGGGGSGNTQANFTLDGAPSAPTFVSLQASPPSQYGYRYPVLTWTNSSNDAGTLTNVKIYRRTFANWALHATLVPNGAAQSQTWQDNSISTAQLGNDVRADYRITTSDNSSPANESPVSQDRSINFGTAMFSDGEKQFQLSQNYPNPFNPSTSIEYQVPRKSSISLRVFDVLGREVSTLVNEVKEAGNYTAIFNASSLSSGVYYYTLRSGGLSQTRRMILAK